MTLAHASAEFRFDLDLSYDAAAPLFGALAESTWAPGWAPQFLHPVPAADIEGAVFRTLDGPDETRLWINTVFDLAGGHIGYVCVLDRVMVTRIDIRLSRVGAVRTHVAVRYERTALVPEANEAVRAASIRDGGYGDEWRRLIERYAQSAR